MKPTFEAMGKRQSNNPTNWKNGVNEIRERLEAVKTRSCWDRGVKGFALDLLESYENICEYCEHNGQLEILCNSEEERNTIRERAKNGNLYDEFNCYYISEEEACRSIDWALFILNIIYSNHEKH